MRKTQFGCEVSLPNIGKKTVPLKKERMLSFIGVE